MSSPVAHSIVGLALGSVVQPRCVHNRFAWLTFSVFAANVPDFDIFAGLALGKVNEFHHGASHSLLAMVVFGALVALVTRHWWPSSWQVGGAAALLFGSHLLVDMLCGPVHELGGTKLLWPFSDAYFRSSVVLFTGIRHGGSQSGLSEFFRELFTLHNLQALGMEAFLTLPWLVVAAWVLARRRARQERPVSSFGSLPELPRLLLRIEHIERRLAWVQGIGLAALVTLPMVIGAMRHMPSEAIDTTQLVLRDNSGRHRAVFMVRNNGRPMLMMYDIEGRERMILGVSDEEEPVVALLGQDEKAQATLKLYPDDRPVLSLNQNKVARGVLAIHKDGTPGLSFYDDQGRAIQRLPVVKVPDK